MLSDFGYFGNEGKKTNRSIITQRSQVDKNVPPVVWTLKFEQPSEVTSKIVSILSSVKLLLFNLHLTDPFNQLYKAI